jgi:hypothetical protein
MLKIVEVVVLIGAGLCFVVWQFRDLRRSRELTRKQREAEQAQAMQAASVTQNSSEKRDADGG